ncbi:MAG: hypothetical protein H0U72_06865 [Nitrosospira sp.]|nr:hypothetical protein [Nitrosospira sp.]
MNINVICRVMHAMRSGVPALVVIAPPRIGRMSSGLGIVKAERLGT